MTRQRIQQGLRVLLCLSMLLIHAPVHARPHITFSCWLPPETPVFQFIEDLYREAFAALGYSFEMHHQPVQRALMEAHSGMTDGECLRAKNLPPDYRDTPLLRVDTLVANADMEAWSTRADLRIDSVEDLLATPYRIGYLRGTDSLNELSARYKLHNVPVTSTAIGLKMLSAGRLDIYIEPGPVIKAELKKLALPVPLYRAGALMPVQGYPYLHQRHEHLLEQLAQQLLLRLPDGGLNSR